MRNIEGLMKIPDEVKEWYQNHGVTKLPDFLQPTFVYLLENRPDWAKCTIETKTIPATAGNVEYDIDEGEGYRFKVLYGAITLVADATVANRKPFVEINNAGGTRIGPSLNASTAITASQTRITTLLDWDIGDHGDGKGYTTGDQGLICCPFIVQGPNKLTIGISGGQAGDSYSGSVTIIKMKVDEDGIRP